MRAADLIYEKYNKNGVVYDFSCGWGIRLLSALKHKIQYIGTDPNYILCERLESLYSDWHDNIDLKAPACTIYPHGSEIFISKLENKIGLSFSSPPYFSLEDYKIGNQSYKPGMQYSEWINNYLKPTIDNIYLYLIKDGILAINIKNTKYKMVDDILKITNEKGFKYIETLPLKNIKRQKSNGGQVDTTDEGIYIFIKES